MRNAVSSLLAAWVISACSNEQTAGNSTGSTAGSGGNSAGAAPVGGGAGADSGAPAIGGSSAGSNGAMSGAMSGAAGAGGAGLAGSGGAGNAGGAGSGGSAGESTTCTRPTPETAGVSASAVLIAQASQPVTTEGAVLENLDLMGDLPIAASNVTIRNCRIHGHVSIAAGVTGTLLEHTEIVGPADASSGQPGLGNHDFTLRRVRIRGFTVFVRALSGQMRIEHSVLDSPCTNRSDELITGVAGYVPGPGSLSLYCNVIDMKKTDAACQGQIDHSIQLNNQDDPEQTLTLEIDHNFLDGGNYSVNLEHGFASLALTNNRWGRAAEYGPVLIDHLQLVPPSQLVWENNAFDDDQQVIPAPQ